MLIDIIAHIVEAFVYLYISYIIGKVILIYWALLHMIDDESGNMQIINPNDPDFFPNFDLFKQKVMEIEKRDMETRLYLLSRKNRLNKVKQRKYEDNKS